MSGLILGLSRGRLLDQSLELLAAAGIEVPGIGTRELLVPARGADMQVVVARGVDVMTLVAHGAAHAGVVGSDVLLEYGPDNLYEILDLGIGRCRVVTAGPEGVEPQRGGKMRVAAKLMNIASGYYAEQGRQVEIIGLRGGVEMAPLLGLCEEIVDIVDTGKTLRDNGLQERETVVEISARFIVNKAALVVRAQPVRELLDRLRAQVGAQVGV